MNNLVSDRSGNRFELSIRRTGEERVLFIQYEETPGNLGTPEPLDGTVIVDDIAQRDALATANTIGAGNLVYVEDASADNNIASGSALYLRLSASFLLIAPLVGGGARIYADITARNADTDIQEGALALVLNASLDPNVVSGYAVYAFVSGSYIRLYPNQFVYPVTDIAARNALTGSVVLQEGYISVVSDASADSEVASGAGVYIFISNVWVRIYPIVIDIPQQGTFENGLTTTGDVTRLGGVLNRDTTITGAHAFNLGQRTPTVSKILRALVVANEIELNGGENSVPGTRTLTINDTGIVLRVENDVDDYFEIRMDKTSNRFELFDGRTPGSVGKQGATLRGFGEAGVDDATGANYDTLAATSLIPKAYALSSFLANVGDGLEIIETNGNRIAQFKPADGEFFQREATVSGVTGIAGLEDANGLYEWFADGYVDSTTTQFQPTLFLFGQPGHALTNRFAMFRRRINTGTNRYVILVKNVVNTNTRWSIHLLPDNTDPSIIANGAQFNSNARLFGINQAGEVGAVDQLSNGRYFPVSGQGTFNTTFVDIEENNNSGLEVSQAGVKLKLATGTIVDFEVEVTGSTIADSNGTYQYFGNRFVDHTSFNAPIMYLDGGTGRPDTQGNSFAAFRFENNGKFFMLVKVQTTSGASFSWRLFETDQAAEAIGNGENFTRTNNRNRAAENTPTTDDVQLQGIWTVPPTDTTGFTTALTDTTQVIRSRMRVIPEGVMAYVSDNPNTLQDLDSLIDRAYINRDYTEINPVIGYLIDGRQAQRQVIDFIRTSDISISNVRRGFGNITPNNEPTTQFLIYTNNNNTELVKQSAFDNSVTQITTDNARYVKVDSGRRKIYYAYNTGGNNHNIASIDFDGSNKLDLVTGIVLNNQRFFDIDTVAEEVIFYNNSGELRRVNFDGTGETLITTPSVTSIRGIGITTSFIFYLNDNLQEIRRVDRSNGANEIQVVTPASGQSIPSFVVSSGESFIFARTGAGILRTDLNGGSQNTILASGGGDVLSVDDQSRTVYFIPGASPFLRSVDYDGNNLQALGSSSGFNTGFSAFVGRPDYSNIRVVLENNVLSIYNPDLYSFSGSVELVFTLNP